MNSLKIKKFTLLHLLIFSLLVALATFSLTSFCESKKINEQITTTSACKIDVKRLNGLKYIRPIMFVNEECESDNLAGIKQQIVEIINRYKMNEGVTSASVYIKNYNGWTSINDNEKYKPGSLFKVPVLITILKMNEKTPGFLNKVVTYSKPFSIDKNVAYVSKSIKVGQSYTIKELLNYMIKYSDNNATSLLESYMDMEAFQKIFNDFGLTVPALDAKVYYISASEYSFFMRAIYNAGYLSIDDSEYAAELLTHCGFKDGILKDLPDGTDVAHKFGESGNQTEKQLHESAIVYLNNNPYLITVMTKGKENEKLSKLISEISQVVYVNMNNDPGPNM